MTAYGTIVGVTEPRQTGPVLVRVVLNNDRGMAVLTLPLADPGCLGCQAASRCRRTRFAHLQRSPLLLTYMGREEFLYW
jgi:hypothetical protein